MNQRELTQDEGASLLEFIEIQWNRLMIRRHLVVHEIGNRLIGSTRLFITQYNLYASDALHLATAIDCNCGVFLADDFHFKRLSSVSDEFGILILPVQTSIDEFTARVGDLE